MPYKSAIMTTLGERCDFAQLIKVYAENQENERRYSPAEVTHAEKVPVMGNPHPAKICTSHVERQNLRIRMSGIEADFGGLIAFATVLATVTISDPLPHATFVALTWLSGLSTGYFGIRAAIDYRAGRRKLNEIMRGT